MTCFRKFFDYALLILFILIPAGCSNSGGGTSGTGGGTFTVSGVVRTATSTPVAGIQVSIGQNQAGARLTKISITSGDKSISRDVTNAQGQFNLELDSRPSSVTLLFQTDTFESEIVVRNVPRTSIGVMLELLYHEDSNEIIEESETFEADQQESFVDEALERQTFG